MKRSYSNMSSGDRTDKLFTPTKYSPGKSLQKQRDYGGLMHASGIFSSPMKKSLRDSTSHDALSIKAEMAKHRERVDKIHAQLEKRDYVPSTSSHTDLTNPADQLISSSVSLASSPSLTAASTPLDDSDDELIELHSDSSPPQSPKSTGRSTHASMMRSPYESILQSPNQRDSHSGKAVHEPTRFPSARRSLFTQSFSHLPPVHSTPSSKQAIESINPLISKASARRALFQQSPHKALQSPLKPIRAADAEKVRRSLSNRFNQVTQPIGPDHAANLAN